jgi:hypothetical protein
MKIIVGRFIRDGLGQAQSKTQDYWFVEDKESFACDQRGISLTF